MTLQDLQPGQSGTIKKITNSIGPVRRRLMDMGITPGTKITVEKIAPMGDPIEVTLRSYQLSLRKSEAQDIEIEVCT